MSWVFKVMQGGMEVAGGEGPDRDWVLAEAAHYVMMYGQDGECEAIVREQKPRKARGADGQEVPTKKAPPTREGQRGV